VPLFDYQCLDCGHLVEDVLQKSSDPTLKFCPECAGEIKKLLGAPNFQLKGDGWYKSSPSKDEKD